MFWLDQLDMRCEEGSNQYPERQAGNVSGFHNHRFLGSLNLNEFYSHLRYTKRKKFSTLLDNF